MLSDERGPSLRTVVRDLLVNEYGEQGWEDLGSLSRIVAVLEDYQAEQVEAARAGDELSRLRGFAEAVAICHECHGDDGRAAERALVERATWEVQRVINHWSSVPADVLAERQAELADLEARRDRIAALAAVRPEAEKVCPSCGKVVLTECLPSNCDAWKEVSWPAPAVRPDTEGAEG